MIINGQEVNNLFLKGERFQNISNCYFIKENTKYYKVTYQSNGNAFLINSGANGNLYRNYTSSFFIKNSGKIYTGSPANILKKYHSNAIFGPEFINSGNFVSFDQMNGADYYYLYDEETFKKFSLENYI